MNNVLFCKHVLTILTLSFCQIGYTSFDSTLTYSELKSEILKNKTQLRDKKIDLDSVSQFLEFVLVEKIFPHWYGTTWDFNGYTSTPKKGTIACGYFVSTTLLHIGLNVDRYKLAQQLPIDEARSLALKDTIYQFEHSSTDSLIIQMKNNLDDGLYFIGFDRSHVGFFHKKNEVIQLIHANYIGSGGVTSESINKSQAFSHYKIFYLVRLSRNKHLLNAWLSGKSITVYETPD